MSPDKWVDAVQTAALVTTAGAVIYAFLLLRRELGKALTELSRLFRTHKDMEERIERLWKRIDELEMRQDPRGNMLPLPSLQVSLQEISDRLDRLEKKRPRKPPGPPQQKISWTRSRKR